MKIPQGYSFAGLNAGIKSDRKDLALVYSAVPASAAACFTANKAKAAPILDAERRLPSIQIQAVLINSGNANALTGQSGIDDVETVVRSLSFALNVSTEAIVTASTGVIGVKLPTEKIVAAIPALVSQLGHDPEPAARAIMTTDTRIKMASRVINLSGAEVIISAICKGSGMIAPSLATMIAVVMTDCAIDPRTLHGALQRAMVKSFNNLTVDNDMSTNDVVFALANGKAGNPTLIGPGKDYDVFFSALQSLCEELAKDIAADGEGATKMFTVKVLGVPSESIGSDLARAVAGSSLVKTALFGADPNWGRILATVGARAGSQNFDIDPYLAQVSIQGLEIYHGGPVTHDSAILKARMRAHEVETVIDLKSGPASATAWGCDLSYDYVKINADYTSLTAPRSSSSGVDPPTEGPLATHSPSFKFSLLVEALSYISRFAEKRCVIKYGGAAMVKDSLKHSFCNDINLLRSVGLQPIVVHGGGPEITRTLEKLGNKTEFVDGIRITHASDLKVVEMVLTGAINTEIVTLLNREGAHAVGLSGKDGALLRAKKYIPENGRDLGQVGEITSVNREFLEMLLQKKYVPIISPVGIGDDGQSYNINADQVAAEIAIAIGASKLIYLTDVAGILDGGELVSCLTAKQLAAQLQGDNIRGGMRAKAQSILKALSSGVERVHVIDGRTSHSVIAELFTDRGVGTLITA